MKRMVLVTAILLLTSCAMAPMAARDKEVCRTASLGLYDYFWYYVKTDPLHPLKSEKAEKYRLERFRKRLSKNGYESPEFKVSSRRVERSERKIGIEIYEIRYLMKVKQPTAQ